jgi:hypothetical protein
MQRGRFGKLHGRYRRHIQPHPAAALPLENLEPRVLMAATPAAVSRVSNVLLDLYNTTIAGGDAHAMAQGHYLQHDAPRDRVGVTLRATHVGAMSKALSALGFEVTSSFPTLHFAEGTLPVRSLHAAEAISNFGRYGIEPIYLPVTAAGSVTSQADFVMEADRERATSPGLYDGTGQRVGVISNSYNHLGGASTGIANGDLPAAGVTVIQDSNQSTDTDEGRAMLELVHDVAPGSPLAFATANGGEGNFASNIAKLADPAQGNCKVIVDDAFYFAEPMFQDGVVAQAIDTAVTTRGVNYFSSAGNSAALAYESTAFTTAADTIGPGGNFYDFDTGGGTDTRQQITVPANAKVFLTLQWDDPFYTASGVDTDLDLYLVNGSGTTVAASTSSNLSSQTPVEVITFTNGNTAQTLNVAIRKVAGPNPGRIKYVNYGTSSVTIDQFATNSATLNPHAAATNGQGVAAAPYFWQDSPESFTSKGGATILFVKFGVPIVAQTRSSPQITTVDGTNNSFFGSDLSIEADGKPNFFGTSAAAPHAAAVAALVRQANPGFTPAQVYSRMQSTADDITVSGAGFDSLTGFGLVNAFDAVYPTVSTASLNFSDGFEGGVLPTTYETRSTINGRIQITTANGPFSGTRHVTMDTTTPFASGGVNQKGLNELTLHVNASGSGTKTLTFRQKEFADDDEVMPSTFMNSTNADGVALSVDGVNWYSLVSLTGANSSSSYTLNTFNLTTFAAGKGIALGSDTRIRFQQYGVFPISHPSGQDGMAFDDIAITNTVAQTAATGAPDLVAASDTGTSSADNKTNLDNSNINKTLQFSVGSTISGATVTIYADGTAIGSATAAGTTTNVTTSGGFDLVDGSRTITARQTNTPAGQTESVDSPSLSITVDTVAPTVDVVDVSPDPRTSGVGSVDVNFSELVANFDVADLSLKRNAGSNLLTGSNAPGSFNGVNYTVPNLLSPTSVSGSYILALTASGSGITDAAGNALAANASDAWIHALPAWMGPGSDVTWNSQTKTLDVIQGASVIGDPGADNPAVTLATTGANLSIAPTGGGRVVHFASLSITTNGTVTVVSLGGNRTINNHPVLVIGSSSLTIDSTSKLDLTDNDLIVDYSGASPLSSVEGMVSTGFNFGDWLGKRITSSVAGAPASNGSYALGVAENALLVNPYGNGTTTGPLFAGQSVDNTAVLVKFTNRVDLDLDGLVTGNDAAVFNGAFSEGEGGAKWMTGDVDYDGFWSSNDAAIFNSFYDEGLTQL